MTDDRKKIVKESAKEFKLDRLWGEDWKVDRARRWRYRIGDPVASFVFLNIKAYIVL